MTHQYLSDTALSCCDDRQDCEKPSFVPYYMLPFSLNSTIHHPEHLSHSISQTQLTEHAQFGMSGINSQFMPIGPTTYLSNHSFPSKQPAYDIKTTTTANYNNPDGPIPLFPVPNYSTPTPASFYPPHPQTFSQAQHEGMLHSNHPMNSFSPHQQYFHLANFYQQPPPAQQPDIHSAALRLLQTVLDSRYANTSSSAATYNNPITTTSSSSNKSVTTTVDETLPKQQNVSPPLNETTSESVNGGSSSSNSNTTIRILRRPNQTSSGTVYNDSSTSYENKNSKPLYQKSLEEREAHYAAARLRIMGSAYPEEFSDEECSSKLTALDINKEPKEEGEINNDDHNADANVEEKKQAIEEENENL